MPATNIDLHAWSNETIIRQFTLLSGDASSQSPLDLSDSEFVLEIRDSKGGLVHRATSGDEGGIVEDDAANGIFSLRLPQGTLTFDARNSWRYDILMLTDNGAEIKRLWGGSFRLSAGTSLP